MRALLPLILAGLILAGASLAAQQQRQHAQTRKLHQQEIAQVLASGAARWSLLASEPLTVAMLKAHGIAAHLQTTQLAPQLQMTQGRIAFTAADENAFSTQLAQIPAPANYRHCQLTRAASGIAVECEVEWLRRMESAS